MEDYNILSDTEDTYNILDAEVRTALPESLVESESVYTALLSGSPDVVDTYKKTKLEFTQTGSSEQYTNVQRDLLQVQEEALANALADVVSDPSLPMEQKMAALYKDLPPLRPANLRQAVQDNELALQPEENENQREIKQADIQFATLPDMAEAIVDTESLRDILQSVVASSPDPTMLGVMGDMIRQMIPGYTSLTSQKILNSLAEKWEFRNKDVDPSLGAKFVLPGELNEVWKKEFLSLPVKDRKEFIKHLASAIEEATQSGVLGKNDFEQYAYIIEAVDMVEDPTDPLDWDRVVGDVIGVFDLVFMGQIIRGGARLGRFGAEVIKGYANYRSAYNTLSSSVRDEVIALLATGAIDPAVAKALGTDPMTIAAHSILPAAPGQLTARSAAAVSDVVAQLQVLQGTLAALSGRIPGLTIADKLSFHKQVLKNIPKYKDHHLFPQLSGVVSDEAPEVVSEATSFMLRTVFGSDNKVGFSSARKAESAAKDKYPTENSLLLIRDPITKTVRPIKPGDDLTQGEFFYSITKPYDYGPSATSVLKDAVAPFGIQTRYFLDTQHIFDRDLLHMPATIAGDRHRAIEKLFLTTFSTSFGKLTRKTKLDVVTAIAEESRRGSRYTVDELVNMGWTSDHFRGYTTIRGTFDVMYSMANKHQYKYLQNEGYQWLRVTGKEGMPVKPLSAGSAGTASTKGLDVYDPIADAIVTMTPAQVKDLYKNGGQLGTILHAEIKGNRSTKFVRIDENPTMMGTSVVRAEVSDLPKSVLPYNDTYYTRYYKDRFFIMERGKGYVNGAPTDQFDIVLGVAASKGDAANAIKKLKAQNPGKNYFDLPAVKLDNEGDRTAAALTYTLDRRSNQPLFGQRGAHLTDMTTGGLAEIYNPIEALNSAIKTVSKSVMFDDMLETMRMRWVAKYSDKTFPIAPKKDNKHYFPANNSDIGRVEGASPAAVKQARAEWEYINFLAGKNDPITVWTRLWHVVANSFVPGTGRLSNGVRGALYNLGEKDPLGAVRALNFTLMIGLAPIRQLLLQTQQFLYIAPLDMKYTMSGAFVPHYMGLTMGIGTIETPKLFAAMKPVFSRLLGMSEDEAEQFIRAFRDSGLPYSIDSHLIGRDSLKRIASEVGDGAMMSMAKGAANVATAPLRAAKKIGFDFGEYNNLAISYLYAKRDFAKKFKGVDWKKKSSQEWIGARARELALSMNAESAFKYQRGWASLALQFMQIQHKALLSSLQFMVPGKSMQRNSPFTRGESAKIFLGQSLLWGAEGVGLAKSVQYIMDKLEISTETPEGQAIAQTVQTGFGEAMINHMLDWAFNNSLDGKPFNFSIASQFAPASGFFSSFGPFTIAILTGEKPWQQAFLGPTWANMGRFQEFGSAVHDIFHTESPRDARFWTGVGKAATLLSSFGTKAQRIMFALGVEKEAGNPYWYDSKYSIIRDATVEELAALGLFGISPHDIEGYYRLRQDQTASKREAKEMAEGFYTRLKRKVALINDEHGVFEGYGAGYSVYQEYLANEESWLGMIKDTDEEMYGFIQDAFVDLIYRDIDAPTGEERLTDNIAKMLFGSEIFDSRGALENKLRRAGVDEETISGIMEEYDFGVDMREMSNGDL